MEKYLTVFRIRTADGKHKYGYSWLKKPRKALVISTANRKLEQGDALVQAWSVDWREPNYKYKLEFGSGMEAPEQDFVPLIRGQYKFRSSKDRRDRMKQKVSEGTTKPSYTPSAYTLQEAPPRPKEETMQ